MEGLEMLHNDALLAAFTVLVSSGMAERLAGC